MTAFPEAVTVKLVEGMIRRIARAAKLASQSPAEWQRAVLRRACEASERAERRRKAAK